MTQDEHKELDDLREQVDEVDLRYLNKFAELWRELLNERRRIVQKIGEYKRKGDLGITDRKREEAVIRDRVEKGHNKDLPREVVKKMWEHVIEDAKVHE